MISGGVCLASYGELRFDTFGFIVQALAVAVSNPRYLPTVVLTHEL